MDAHLSQAEWNALGQEERVAIVEQAHADTKSAAGQDPHAHATIHVMVEDRLAAGDAAATRAFERFRAAGVSRHHAIHALASVVTRHMLTMLEKGAPPDEETANRDFDALDPAVFQRKR